MSFFRYQKKNNCRQIIIQTFLRAKVFIKNIFISYLLSILKTGKRMSFFPSFLRRYKAGMTVEASLIVPFFLFFMMNILFSLEMLRLHGNIAAALHQTGNRMAFGGYAYKTVGQETPLPGELASVAISEGYVRGSLVKQLGADYLNHTCLLGGTAGLHFGESSLLENEDRIDIVVSYRVKPFIRVIGFPDFLMKNRYFGKAWTGYDVTSGQGELEVLEKTVYITETGSVYHEMKNCAYLCPSIVMIPEIAKGEARNESGGKYYACERCGGDGLQAVLFITAEGNRYHNSLRCPGLKRTVYTVRLKDVGNKGACSKCAGG